MSSSDALPLPAIPAYRRTSGKSPAAGADCGEKRRAVAVKDDGDTLVGEDARHRPRGVGHDLVGVVFLLHLVAVCLILLGGDPAVGGYP